MLSGRYRSWFGFVRDKVAEDGIARLYRGFAITVVKDIVGFAAFFGLFEITKIELLDLYRNLHMEARRLRSRHLGEDGEVAVRPADAGAQKLTRKEVVELRRRATRPSREEQRRSQEGAEAKSDVLEAIGNSIRAPMVVLPSLLLPPYLGQASCVLIAGAVAALAYQAVDYPLEQLRNYVYTELADTELISVIQKRAHAGSVPVEWRPYRHIWMGLKRHAAKELGANPDHFWTPIRYLYSGWWGVAVRSVPAASIGLVFYEVIKQWLQSDDLQLLAPP
ncbi:hypothetical protein EV182_007193 [Spiromyces aspiralis]|uniref:Uncharacterized protein n=1 Tax=Spiromyces aspiralis TaxID=68401 RepID=A0ACC1HSN7_9FUNG|nr:hypothetical protein EV182_007193 [Spiromyces aspiralis]